MSRASVKDAVAQQIPLARVIANKSDSVSLTNAAKLAGLPVVAQASVKDVVAQQIPVARVPGNTFGFSDLSDTTVSIVRQQTSGVLLPGNTQVTGISTPPLYVDKEGYGIDEADDVYRIKIPQGSEHFIGGKYVRSVADTVIDVTTTYASLLNVSSTDLQQLNKDWSKSFDDILREFSVATFRAEVKADAATFVYPNEVFSKDSEAYVAGESCLEDFLSQIQRDRSADRFNVLRCNEVFSTDPEYSRLLSLAQDGVIIDTPDDLIRQSVPEPPRQLQQQLDLVYRKHASKVWAKGYGVILRHDILSKADLDRIHFNPAHITPKPPGGSRFLMDCSNSESGNVLNTPEVKEKVIERYGRIKHETFTTIVCGWYDYVEREGILIKDCRIFKDDFSGAFAQMNVNPSSAYFLYMAIVSGLILVYFAGLFGWLGFPMAFAVFSRAFQRKFRDILRIPVVLYVDDIIALSQKDNADQQQREVELLCEKAMGSKAIAYEKQVRPCVACDVLGWYTDLQSETFRPCMKGSRKLVFAFWLVASGEEFPLVVYMLLASLAQHYSFGLPGMKPFVYPLHSMVARFHNNTFYKKKPSSAAKMSIEFLRVVSILSLQNHKLMCRPLRSIVSRPSSQLGTVVITDASPSGLGIALYTDNNVLISYMGYQYPFYAEDQHQCAREYIAYMFAYIFLEWVLGDVECTREATWFNDNKAAISWAQDNKCNSLAAQFAFTVVTWQLLSSQFTFTEIDHRKGIIMGDIDSLSRGYAHSLDINKEFRVSASRLVTLDKLFFLLDPTKQLDLIDHHAALDTVIRLTKDLCQRE